MLVVYKYDFRLGTNGSQLASVAFSRLQKEIAKDGREPNVISKGVPNKSISRKGSDGKTAIAEGLALRIAKADVSPFLLVCFSTIDWCFPTFSFLICPCVILSL